MMKDQCSLFDSFTWYLARQVSYQVKLSMTVNGVAAVTKERGYTSTSVGCVHAHALCVVVCLLLG